MYSLKIEDKLITNNIEKADSFIKRAKGLMFNPSMPKDKGLWIIPCNSIHTAFMFYNIDVVFVDKNLKVIKIIRNLKPWRMTRMYFKAHSVLEFNGDFVQDKIDEGDHLELCIN